MRSKSSLKNPVGFTTSLYLSFALLCSSVILTDGNDVYHEVFAKVIDIFKSAANIEQMDPQFIVFVLMNPYEKTIWTREDYLYNYLEPKKHDGGGIYFPDTTHYYSPLESDGFGNYLIGIPPPPGATAPSLLGKDSVFWKMWDKYVTETEIVPEIFMYTWEYPCITCASYFIHEFGHTSRYSAVPTTIGFTDWGHNSATINSFQSEVLFNTENQKRPAPINRLRIRYTREELLFYNLFKYTAFQKFFEAASPDDKHHDFAVLMVLHPSTRSLWDQNSFADYYLKPVDDNRQPLIPSHISQDIIKPHLKDAENYFVTKGTGSGTGTNAAVFKLMGVDAAHLSTSEHLQILLDKYEEVYGKDEPYLPPDIVVYTYVYPNTFIANQLATCLANMKGDGNVYLGFSTIGNGLFINPASDNDVFEVRGVKVLNVTVHSLPPHQWPEYIAPIDKHEDAPGNQDDPNQASVPGDDAADGGAPGANEGQAETAGDGGTTAVPGGAAGAGDTASEDFQVVGVDGGFEIVEGEVEAPVIEAPQFASVPGDEHLDTSLIEKRPRICTAEIITPDAVKNFSAPIADCHSIQTCAFNCINWFFECGKVCCCCDVNSGPAMIAYLINSVINDCRYLTMDEEAQTCWKTWLAWNVQRACDCRGNDAPTLIYSCLLGASKLSMEYSKPLDVSIPFQLQPPMFRFDDLETYEVVQSNCFPPDLYTGFVCAAPGEGPDSGFRPGISGQIGPTDAPTNTSIRLVGSNNTFEGTVEIYHSGVWGVVCDDNWDLPDAQVVCRSLGFPGADAAISQAYYGQSPGPFWLDDVDCAGTEKNLDDCVHRTWGEHDCYPFEEAGVKCSQVVGPLAENQIRLVDGLTENEGRVEVYHNDHWGTICDDKFDLKDGIVICRQLGYPSVEQIYTRAYFGPGSGRIYMDNLDCGGGENRVEECDFPGWGDNDCSAAEDAGVRCQARDEEDKPGTGVPRDCRDVLRSLQTSSGIYTIQPEHLEYSVDVYCDMNTDGGGWTVIQRRDDGIVDFHRSWSDYKAGFGDLTDEFWIGNEVLYRMTAQGRYALRIDLEDFVGNYAHAVYGSMVVLDESENYQLLLDDFLEGGARDSMLGSSALTSQSGTNNRMPFSTYDRRNPDSQATNCVDTRRSGWWFNVECGSSNLNGVYYDYDDDYLNPPQDSIHWYSWTYSHLALKKASMKIKIID